MSSQDKQLRDALEMLVDGFEAILTKFRQDIGLPTQRPKGERVDVSKIVWVETESTQHPGSKYKKATDAGNVQSEEYPKLKALLDRNNGKATIATDQGAMFVWLFREKDAVGMSPAKWQKKESK